MYCPLHFSIRQYLWVEENYSNLGKYSHVSMQTLKKLSFNAKCPYFSHSLDTDTPVVPADPQLGEAAQPDCIINISVKGYKNY